MYFSGIFYKNQNFHHSSNQDSQNYGNFQWKLIFFISTIFVISITEAFNFYIQYYDVNCG